MFGTVSQEIEVPVSASKTWELYGTFQLAKLVEEQLKSVLEKVEVVEGDGGVGTVLKLTFAPGTPGVSSYKEKFTKVDDEKRVKETEVVEGGYLDLGFTLFRIRFEVIEKNKDSCITRSTIEYNVKEEAAVNASFVSIQPLVMLMEAAANHLDLGFTLFRVRFEIIEKSEESCITRSTIEYDVKEEAAANASVVSIQLLVMIMEAAANQYP